MIVLRFNEFRVPSNLTALLKVIGDYVPNAAHEVGKHDHHQKQPDHFVHKEPSLQDDNLLSALDLALKLFQKSFYCFDVHQLEHSQQPRQSQ